ncbi:MAG: 50S ribosomal protein L15 [Patescibacteria group bacterium]
MQLHNLQRRHPLAEKKPRVGRGGKRGSTSGRGQKGQKSRSGHRIRPAERDLLQRLPKLRGFNNKPLSKKMDVINVGDLAAKFKSGSVIGSELLGRNVKVLGNGDLKMPITLRGVKVSKSAKEKIEAAGGKVE